MTARTPVVIGTDGLFQQLQAADTLTDNIGLTSYTPTITPGAGAFTTATATGRYRILLGKLIFVQIEFTITTVGTATGIPSLSLPFAAAAFRFHICGRDNGSSGKAIVGTILAGSSCLISAADGTNVNLAGALIDVSGVYPLL